MAEAVEIPMMPPAAGAGAGAAAAHGLGLTDEQSLAFLKCLRAVVLAGKTLRPAILRRAAAAHSRLRAAAEAEGRPGGFCCADVPPLSGAARAQVEIAEAAAAAARQAAQEATAKALAAKASGTPGRLLGDLFRDATRLRMERRGADDALKLLSAQQLRLPCIESGRAEPCATCSELIAIHGNSNPTWSNSAARRWPLKGEAGWASFMKLYAAKGVRSCEASEIDISACVAIVEWCHVPELADLRDGPKPVDALQRLRRCRNPVMHSGSGVIDTEEVGNVMRAARDTIDLVLRVEAASGDDAAEAAARAAVIAARSTLDAIAAATPVATVAWARDPATWVDAVLNLPFSWLGDLQQQVDSIASDVMELKRQRSTRGVVSKAFTPPRVDPNAVFTVGSRKADCEKLTNMLLGRRGVNPDVSFVHGISGMGKSTLAAFVASLPDVRARFVDGVYWLKIGNVKLPDILGLLRPLVSELRHDAAPLPMSSSESEEREILSRELAECLEGSTCLLVLDDVWSAGVLSKILVGDAWPNSGSKVLVTSRHREIAEASPLHALRQHALEVLRLDTESAVMVLMASYQQAVHASLESDYETETAADGDDRAPSHAGVIERSASETFYDVHERVELVRSRSSTSQQDEHRIAIDLVEALHCHPHAINVAGAAAGSMLPEPSLEAELANVRGRNDMSVQDVIDHVFDDTKRLLVEPPGGSGTRRGRWDGLWAAFLQLGLFPRGKRVPVDVLSHCAGWNRNPSRRNTWVHKLQLLHLISLPADTEAALEGARTAGIAPTPIAGTAKGTVEFTLHDLQHEFVRRELVASLGSGEAYLKSQAALLRSLRSLGPTDTGWAGLADLSGAGDATARYAWASFPEHVYLGARVAGKDASWPLVREFLVDSYFSLPFVLAFERARGSTGFVAPLGNITRLVVGRLDTGATLADSVPGHAETPGTGAPSVDSTPASAAGAETVALLSPRDAEQDSRDAPDPCPQDATDRDRLHLIWRAYAVCRLVGCECAPVSLLSGDSLILQGSRKRSLLLARLRALLRVIVWVAAAVAMLWPLWPADMQPGAGGSHNTTATGTAGSHGKVGVLGVATTDASVSRVLEVSIGAVCAFDLGLRAALLKWPAATVDPETAPPSIVSASGGPAQVRKRREAAERVFKSVSLTVVVVAMCFVVLTFLTPIPRGLLSVGFVATCAVLDALRLAFFVRAPSVGTPRWLHPAVVAGGGGDSVMFSHTLNIFGVCLVVVLSDARALESKTYVGFVAAAGALSLLSSHSVITAIGVPACVIVAVACFPATVLFRWVTYFGLLSIFSLVAVYTKAKARQRLANLSHLAGHADAVFISDAVVRHNVLKAAALVGGLCVASVCLVYFMTART